MIYLTIGPPDKSGGDGLRLTGSQVDLIIGYNNSFDTYHEPMFQRFIVFVLSCFAFEFSSTHL